MSIEFIPTYLIVGPYPEEDTIKKLEADNNNVLVNCTTEYDQLPPIKTILQVVNIPIHRRYQPDIDEEFAEQYELLDDLTREGKRLIIFSDEEDRAAFVGLCLVTKKQNIELSEGIDIITKINNDENNILRNGRPMKPEFKNTKVPRSLRQLNFAERFITGKSYESIKVMNHVKKAGIKENNRLKGNRGKVRTSFLTPHGCGRPTVCPYVLGYELVTSAKNFGKINPRFSNSFTITEPNKIGEDEKNKVKNLEVFIYSLEVYPEWTDENGDPTDEYFLTRYKFWTKGTPTTHNPFAPKRSKVLYYWWKGMRLNEQMMRLIVYAPFYETLVKNTNEYKDLVHMLEKGTDILLLDYDMIDFKEEGITLSRSFVDLKYPFSHFNILYGMLTDNKVWARDDLMNQDGTPNNKVIEIMMNN